MRTYPTLRLYIGNETIIFSGTQILDATVTQEVSPLSLELPASQANVTIYTTDPRFNPFTEGEFYQSLAANTPADLYETVGDTEHYIGRFFLETWDNPSEGVLTFNFQDAIGVMTNTPFDGLFYENPTALKDVILNLQTHAPVPIKADTDIKDTQISGYLKGNSNLREALQQVLFAARAYAITFGRDHIQINKAEIPAPEPGTVPAYYDDLLAIYGLSTYQDPLEPLSIPSGATINEEPTTSQITDTDKLGKQTLKVLPMVTGIDLITHNFTKGTVKETIYEDYLEPGDYKIVYEKPYGDVTVSGVGDIPEYLATEDGSVFVTEDSGTYPYVTIIGKTGVYEFGPNSISLNVQVAGTVLVEGYPYNDNTQALLWKNPRASQAVPNAWKIESATMVGKEVGPDIQALLMLYASARHEHTLIALPHLQVIPGEIYTVTSLYDKRLTAIAESITIDLTGGYLKETRLIGVERIEA